MTTARHREALARVIDPEMWEESDREAARKIPEVRDRLRRDSLRVADRIIESGLMTKMEWEPREYHAAHKRIVEATSRKGYCYSVSDCLDGYEVHDPRCPHWPDSAVGGSGCIR